MAEILLVRHAQASFGAADYDQLSQLGHQQSAWLGAYLAAHGSVFDRIVIGGQLRHQQTLDGAISQLSQLPTVEILPALNEFDFTALLRATLAKTGEVQPTRREDFYRLLKRALAFWQANELPGNLPETWAQFQGRVLMALNNLQTAPAKRTLAISSGGPISTIAAHVLDAPPHTMIELNLQIRNTAMTQLFANSHALRLLSFNHVAHLDDPARLAAITFA
jgi:broad specificity phosphatase PhoE